MERGAGHCGSTLLNLCLDRHSLVFGASEIISLNRKSPGWSGNKYILNDTFWSKVNSYMYNKYSEKLSKVPFNLSKSIPSYDLAIERNKIALESILNISGKKIICDSIKKEIIKTKNIDWHVDFNLSGEPFLTKPDKFINIVSNAVKEVTGIEPELSTSGGTSDARFIKDICPVIEFGSVGKTMHKINEKVSVKDLEALTKIYYEIISNYKIIANK